MAGISFMGVGSGLPVKEIIKATLDAEAAPLARLDRDKKFYESQISAMGQLNSRLGSMRDAMEKLQGLDKFQQLASNSGNEKLFTATADHKQGATAGGYSLEVLAEARNYKQTSSSFSRSDTIANAGDDAKLVFSGLKDKDGNTLADISIDTAGKTLDEVRQAINDHDDLKKLVSANLVNTSATDARLVLKAQESGEEKRFTAEFTGTNVPVGLSSKDVSLSSDSSSLDALIKIDGIEASSATNTFENVISGVTINVTAGAMNETNKNSSLSVKRDDGAIKDNIDAFTKAYNDVIIHLNESKKGSLYGDSTIRTIESEMRNILYAPTEGADSSDTNQNFLALIGIEIYVDKNYDPKSPNSRNGTLQTDSAMLTKALDENFDKVAHILGSSNKIDETQPSGYAQRLGTLADQLLNGYIRDGKVEKGLVQIRTEGLNKEVTRIDDKVAASNRRLDLMEQRLVRQFSAIEGIIANLNSTGSYIGQQMANLPGYSRK